MMWHPGHSTSDDIIDVRIEIIQNDFTEVTNPKRTEDPCELRENIGRVDGPKLNGSQKGQYLLNFRPLRSESDVAEESNSKPSENSCSFLLPAGTTPSTMDEKSGSSVVIKAMSAQSKIELRNSSQTDFNSFDISYFPTPFACMTTTSTTSSPTPALNTSLRLSILRLKGVTIDPDTFSFPKLKTLNLDECSVIQDSTAHKKLHLPSLDTLRCSIAFASIHESIDYWKTPLSKLYLFDITDLESLEHIQSTSLSLLRLHRCFITSLCDLHLNNLNHFSEIDGGLVRVSNVVFGKLVFWEIISTPSQHIHLQEVYMPMLEHLGIWCISKLSATGVSFPSLKYAKLRFISYSGPGRKTLKYSDTSLFRTSESVEFEGDYDTILNDCEASNSYPLKQLTELHISQCHVEQWMLADPQTLHPSYKFPNARELSIYNCDQSAAVINFALIKVLFPKLERLSLYEIWVPLINDVFTLRSLKFLSISLYVPRVSARFRLTLPNLEEMRISLRGRKEVSGPVTLPMDTPKLTCLQLTTEYPVSELELLDVNHPKIEDLSLTGDFRCIYIGTLCSMSLKLLKIHSNESLERFMYHGRLEKLVLLEGSSGTPYMFQDLDAPLLGSSAVEWKGAAKTSGWKREAK